MTKSLNPFHQQKGRYLQVQLQKSTSICILFIREGDAICECNSKKGTYLHPIYQRGGRYMRVHALFIKEVDGLFLKPRTSGRRRGQTCGEAHTEVERRCENHTGCNMPRSVLCGRGCYFLTCVVTAPVPNVSPYSTTGARQQPPYFK